ncbi:hypothetical protein GALMADRAFT_234615 [Galerina marginata CBS 339.88]|uniref:Uncharacterized protein n=1 Tax=Galerina marginata (strain CBS 339.88) TaxID=685588 RepID=A0A067TTG9_GALM3|nr:hypothetical protein GALMADRAFT_234615 [Galerina marginata CBS 339.88]
MFLIVLKPLNDIIGSLGLINTDSVWTLSGLYPSTTFLYDRLDPQTRNRCSH